MELISFGRNIYNQKFVVYCTRKMGGYFLMKLKKILAIILGLIISILIIATAFSEDKVLLRINLQKNKSYLMKTSVSQIITQTVNEKDMKINQLIGMNMTYNILDVDPNGISTIKITYSAIQFFQDGPTGKIEYDSSKPSKDLAPAAQGFAALVGQSLTVKMTSTNKLIEIQGVNEILDNLARKFSNNTATNAIMNNLKGLFDDESLKQMFEGDMAYPENPVSLGDSWAQKVTLSKIMPMIIEKNFTLKERNNGVAIIETKATVKSNESAPPMNLGTASVQYTLTGTYEGTLDLDEKTGMTLKSTIFLKISGNLLMTLSSKSDQSYTFPIKIDSVSTSELSEVKI